jgi:ribonuclease-3
MHTPDDIIQNAAPIEQRLGYTFKDKSLLALAFVHRSYVNENRSITEQHNERLEFLGDSVLGLLIAEYLYRNLPTVPEGELSYLRSRLVEASSCVIYVQKMQIEEFILLGRGEKMNDGRGRESILADLFEAVIGAIYLDGGLEAAFQFVFTNFNAEIKEILGQPMHNWKALLQDYSQKHFQRPPRYMLISESGPDHSKHFEIAVLVNDEEWGRGIGPSKKEAQQAAAKQAMEHALWQR